MSRLIASGELVEYDAIFHTDGEGRAVFERVRQAYSAKIDLARALFLAAEDLPIPGRPQWYSISNHPVQISRHTEGRTMTRVVMDAMGYEPSLCLPL